jgi:hypothetical protein
MQPRQPRLQRMKQQKQPQRATRHPPKPTKQPKWPLTTPRRYLITMPINRLNSFHVAGRTIFLMASIFFGIGCIPD